MTCYDQSGKDIEDVFCNLFMSVGSYLSCIQFVIKIYMYISQEHQNYGKS